MILYTPFPIPGWKFRPGGDCGSCFCSSKRSPVTDIDFYGGHCLLCVMNVFVERWPAIKISNGDKCNVPREQRNALPPVLANVLARVLSLERSLLPSSNHREPRITLPRGTGGICSMRLIRNGAVIKIVISRISRCSSPSSFFFEKWSRNFFIVTSISILLRLSNSFFQFFVIFILSWRFLDYLEYRRKNLYSHRKKRKKYSIWETS